MADGDAEIADVLVRYATSIDQRDWDLFRTCFTADCEADYGAIGNWSGVEAIAEWMRATHEPCGHTLHRITNQAVTVRDDSASARSYVDAIVLFGDNQTGTRAAGYYDDEFVRVDGEWRIAVRRFTTVMLQLIPDGTIISLEP